LPVPIGRTRQGSDPNHIVIDLDDLGHRLGRPLPDHQPRSLHHEDRITSLVQEGPQQAGITLAVESTVRSIGSSPFSVIATYLTP